MYERYKTNLFGGNQIMATGKKEWPKGMKPAFLVVGGNIFLTLWKDDYRGPVSKCVELEHGDIDGLVEYCNYVHRTEKEQHFQQPKQYRKKTLTFLSKIIIFLVHGAYQNFWDQEVRSLATTDVRWGVAAGLQESLRNILPKLQEVVPQQT